MIEINLFDDSFSHLETEDGIYSMTDNKKPSYTRYVRVKEGWEGISLFTDSYLDTDSVTNCKGTNIGMLVETRETNPSIYNSVDNYIDNYDFLLTYDKELLEKYPEKTKFYPFGGCWVEKENYGFPEKTEMVSMIYSTKREAFGHSLRHKIASSLKGIDLWGAGAGRPFETKEEALSPYRFTVVIENTKNPYYFSEKLLDAMALGVIPIYYGATEIGNFFNSKGILTFDTIEELEEILNTLTPELYDSMFMYAEENQKLVSKYDTQEDWIFENVLLENSLIDQNITDDLDVTDILTYVDGHTQYRHLSEFFSRGGDSQLSYFPELTEDSVIWDLGSYTGEYSTEIYDKYRCTCYGFEPVKDLYDRSLSNENDKIKFFNFGLGKENGTFSISVSEDESSFMLEGGKREDCKVRGIAEVFEELDVDNIDVMKLNVEGSEFDILEELLDSGLHTKVDKFLIQFHYYGRFPVYRRNKILDKLSKTHKMKFSYPFVWECWEGK
jgi:FkbM family methyltransferase